MNKLYNVHRNLIGYNSDGINTSSRKQLFDIEAALIGTKLNALGISENDRGQYYSKVIQKYDIPGLEIRADIPYFKDTGVEWKYKPTSCKVMFCKCKAQSIDLSSLDTSNVTDMSNMFYKCEAQSLYIVLFDTSKVISMHSMFNSCKSQSLDLSSFDTSNVTDMSKMFRDCKAQSINLSSFNTSKVTDMGGMFRDCKAQSINLSSFNTSNVTSMYNMFCECKAQHIKINQQAFDEIYEGEDVFGTDIDNRFEQGDMTPDKFKSICTIV